MMETTADNTSDVWQAMANAAAELARLRAIESAAIDYRAAYTRDDIWGDEWTIACVECRSRLFALLDGSVT